MHSSVSYQQAIYQKYDLSGNESPRRSIKKVNFVKYIFSWIFKKREFRGNMYGLKIYSTHFLGTLPETGERCSSVVELSSVYPNVTSCKMLCLVSPQRHGLGITLLLFDPQLPKGCGWLGLFVPSTQNDSYSKKYRGQSWDSWSLILSVNACKTKSIALFSYYYPSLKGIVYSFQKT